MPLQGIFRALNMRVEGAIGADRLKPGTRSQLLVEQIDGIAQMTPATSAGALVISLLLMVTSRDLPVFASVVAWSAALYAALLVAMLGWLRDNERRGREHHRRGQSAPPC